MKQSSTMIQTVLLVVLVLFSLTGSAQRVRFSTIRFKYFHLPLYPLDQRYETFQSILNIVLPDDTREADKLVSQYLKIPGYQKTTTNPDLQIVATFGDFSIAEKKLQSDDVFNVNEGKNMTGYLYRITCEYPINLKVLSASGEEVCNIEIIPDGKNMQFDFGKWEYSREALDSKFESEGQQLLLEKQNKCITEALSEIRDLLNSYYGMGTENERIRIASGKDRKYDYSDLDEAIMFVEKAMEENVNLLEENETRTGELNKAIKIWLARTGKDQASRKKEGTSPEICQMLWYNCAIAYLWNGEFDRAKEVLASAKNENPGNSSQNQMRLIEDLEKQITDMEKRFLANIKE